MFMKRWFNSILQKLEQNFLSVNELDLVFLHNDLWYTCL